MSSKQYNIQKIQRKYTYHISEYGEILVSVMWNNLYPRRTVYEIYRYKYDHLLWLTVELVKIFNCFLLTFCAPTSVAETRILASFDITTKYHSWLWNWNCCFVVEIFFLTPYIKLRRQLLELNRSIGSGFIRTFFEEIQQL